MSDADQAKSIFATGIFIAVVVFLVILILAPVGLIFGIISLVSTGNRQNKINIFNDKVKIWKTEYIQEFNQTFNNFTISYQIPGKITQIDQHTHQIYQDFDPEGIKYFSYDDPKPDFSFKDMYHQSLLTFENQSIEFNRINYQDNTKIIASIQGYERNGRIDSFELDPIITFDLNCKSQAKGKYCVRYLIGLCYEYKERNGKLNPCYDNAEIFSTIDKTEHIFSMDLSVKLEIRHFNDPKISLHSITDGEMDFGESDLVKIIIGLFLVIPGSIITFIEGIIILLIVIFFCFFCIFGRVNNDKRNQKSNQNKKNDVPLDFL